MARSPVLSFAPFIVIAGVHLVTLLAHDVSLSTVTKPFLMPALLLALLWLRHTLSREMVLLGSLAIIFSWVGDVLLGMPGGIGFVLGLGGFLLAHVTYLVLFARRERVRRVPVLALGYLAWWIALLVLLAPYLGALFVPVALYGLALGAMATVALACNRIIAFGGLAFVVSDTILAFKLFRPDFSLWQADFVIMLLYCGAQGLIVVGLTRSRASRTPVRAD